MEIDSLITKYGGEITKNLKIAGDQVYDKLIWYTQVHAIIELCKWGVGIVFFGICFYIAHRISKKLNLYDDSGPFFIVYLAILIPFVLMCALLDGGTDLVTQIVAPQYWILNSIITKIN